MKKVIRILVAAVVVAAAVFGIIVWQARSGAEAAVNAYNEAAEAYNEKISPYNEASAAVAEANEELQGVMDAAQAVLDQGAEAYEPDTQIALQAELKKAEKALVKVPAQIDPFEKRAVAGSFNKTELENQMVEAEAAAAAVEEAEEKIPPVPEIPDYKEQIQGVESAQKAYTDSVQKLANVTAPPDTFVLDRLRGIKSVVQAEAVTADLDPNGMLGKKDGYTGCVYFLDERIDRSLLPEDAFPEEDGGQEPDGSEDGEDGTPEETAENDNGGEGADASAEEADPAAAAETGRSAAADETETAATAASAAETATAAVDMNERIDVVRIGTEGGGAVEIYANAEEAEARDKYLAFFSGSVMDPGAHAVEGTCVIRASGLLEPEQQEALIQAVREALLSVE